MRPRVPAARPRHRRQNGRSKRRGSAGNLTELKRFRALVEHSAEAICLNRADGTVLYVSPSITRILGYSKSELIGRMGFLFVHPDDVAAAQAVMAQSFARPGVPLNGEVRARHKNGSWRQLTYVFANHLDDPALRAYVCNFRDVTDWRRANEALRSAEKGYRELFDHALVGIGRTTAEGRLVAANPALARIYGYASPDELLAAVEDVAQQHWLDPGRRDEFRRLLEQQGSIAGFETQIRRRGGEVVWVAASSRAVRHEDGSLRYYEGVVEDITERKRAEKALRESEQRFRLAFDHAPIGMALVALDGRWLQVNRALCDLTGYSERELLNTTYQDITHPSDLDADLELAGQVLTGEIERYTMEKRYFHKLGHVVWIRLHVSLARGEKGEPLYFVSQIKDITEQKRAEQALQARARQQAALADLGQLALEGLDLESLMTEAAAVVTRTLDVEMCAVLERLPHRGVLILRAGSGWKTAIVGHSTVSAGDRSHAGFTLLAGEPVVVEDLATETRFTPSSLVRDHGVVSLVSVTIAGAEQPFGVLGAYTSTRRAFAADDVDFLRSIAHVLGAAIIRKRQEDIRRRLLERMMSAQEDERRRIARELHDETGQTLASLLVGLRAVEDARSIGQARASAGRLRQITAEAMDGVGRLARGLHPSVLQDLGLGPALARHAAERGELAGIPVVVDAERLGAERLPVVVETSLYRIAQEAIANVAKHSSATRAAVVLARDDSTVEMRVRDDGRGFDVERALRSAIADGRLGLHGIRERAVLLGGAAFVDSRPGAGTIVTVRIPLPKARGTRARKA